MNRSLHQTEMHSFQVLTNQYGVTGGTKLGHIVNFSVRVSLVFPTILCIDSVLQGELHGPFNLQMTLN